MGRLRDASANWYPRDIGRSSVLSHGAVIYQFGDTFFHDLDGNYTSLVDNTHAIGIDKSNPSLSFSSTSHRPNDQGKEVTENPFIHKLKSEENQDLKLWSFGGVVKKDINHEVNLFQGWTYFEVTKPMTDTLDYDYKYISIAKVYYDPINMRAWTERHEDQQPALFNRDEIRFGDFCTVRDEDIIYVYGHKANNNKDICIASVHKDHAADRNRYRFWNGQSWTRSISSSHPVMISMQHGQIFPTTMFGPDSPSRWAFLGCNAWGDGKVQMGRAPAPEGPWDIRETTVALYRLSQPNDGGFFYCMYPHPFADETEKTGDLTFSWSEGGMSGGVLMSKIRLKMEDY